MEDGTWFRFPQGASGDVLPVILQDDYALRADDPVESSVVFFDTFDWRLFGRGLTLGRSGDAWAMRGLPAGAVLAHETSALTPDFAQAFPDGPLRQRIAPITGVRRLLPAGDAMFHTTPLRVLNADDKTIAWLNAREVQAGPCTAGAARSTVDMLVALQPVRGYRGHFRRLTRRLTQAGFVAAQWQETFERIALAAGRQPGAYSATPRVALALDMRADAAAQLILRRTLTVMQSNEEGIRADWDAEFLHDFRTAVRRTRSALSQIPAVFPPETTQYFRDAFALLGQKTNRLRDLDVYLLAEPDYRALFPAGMGEHITPLFDYLRRQREEAARDVSDYLGSPAYTAVMAAWETFLQEPLPIEPAAPNAAVPIGALARQRIARQYQRVIKDGNRILESDDDERVHQLRIDCKKLRYQLEFFASLFPRKELNRLVKQLKRLQDKLGEFNDLSVQQVYLLQTSVVLPVATAADRLALVAIGSLVENLGTRARDMKPDIVRAFGDFSAAPNRALVRRLLSSNQEGADT